MEDINKKLINEMITDVIVGCGTNPLRPIDGEPCKALAKKNGLSLVLPIISSWNETESIGKVYVLGPKNRLENELKPKLSGLEKCIFVDEECPGDVDALIDNLVKLRNEYKLSRFVVFSGCDMTTFSKEKAHRILTDIKYAMSADYTSGKHRGSNSGFADIYFTIGAVDEDLKHYANKVDRPGAVISKNEIYRAGTVHLYDSINCSYKTAQLKKLFLKRKVKEQHKELILECWDSLGNGLPFFIPTANRRGALKVFSNYIKHYKKNIPLPYFNISLERIEKAANAVTGLNVTLVKTLGSDDIDNDEEFKAACQKKY